MTLKEQMQAKKQAKQARLIQQADDFKIKQLKRERDWKLRNDNISPVEFGCSTYKIYLDRIVNQLEENNLTVQDLTADFVQLHRFTFLDTDYDLSNIRTIIEQLFDKYCHDLGDTATIEQLSVKMNIHYKQRQLLIKFCEIIYAKIASFKSRTVFANGNLSMITDHLCYCGLANPTINRFIARDDLKEAQEIIRQRVHSKELYKNAVNKKQIFIDVTGDFIYKEVK